MRGRGARWLLWFAAVSIATLGALALRSLPAIARWDQAFVENQRRPLAPTDRIDVVAITNETFRELGAANDTPGMNRVSTELLPQLIAALERVGASVLAIDLIYETPREDAQDTISQEYRRKNAVLRKALAQHPRLPVVLVLGYSDVTSSEFTPTPTYTWIPSPIDPQLPHVRAGQAIAAANVQYVYPVLENPLTGGQVCHIGVLMAAWSSEKSWNVPTHEDPSTARFRVAGEWFPVDRSGLIPIRYPATPSVFRTTELTEAIASPQRFRGRIVLVGTVGDTQDRHGADVIDGVYTCASVVATLLEGPELVLPSQSLGLAAIAGFLMAAFGGLVARRGRGTDLLAGFLIFVAVAGLIGTVVRMGYPLGLFVPLASFVLSVLLTLATVAVAFTPRAVKEGAPVEEEIEADYLFVDLVGSTRLSGSMDPREYGRLVAKIVTLSSDVVRRHGGEVANTTGDGILAYFRGRKADPIAAIHECRAVLGSLGDVTFTYGLERGRAVLRETRVGDRFDRALSGEAVNRAAKLQDICPDLGIDVAIGPDFAHRMRSPGSLREVGVAQLPSGAGETPVWTLEP